MPTTANIPDFNPYEAPRGDRDGRPSEFYKIDARRVTYGECRQLSADPLAFLILVAARTLRVPVGFLIQSGIPRAGAIATIGPEAIPPHVLESWRGAIAACEARGLRLRIGFTAPSVGRGKETIVGVFHSEDERLQASAVYNRTQLGRNVREVVTFVARSQLADGRRAATWDRRIPLELPPQVVSRSLPGRTPGEILDRHLEWIDSAGWTPVPVPESELEPYNRAREQEFEDYHVRRGTFVPMTVAEAERLARRAEGLAARPPEGRSWKALRWVERGLLCVILVSLFLPARARARDRTEAVYQLAIASLPLVGLVVIWTIRHVASGRDRSPPEGAA